MKIIYSPSSRSSGSVLVIAIVVTGLVGFVLAVYLNLLSSQSTSTMRSQAWNASIPVIEAGIEEALSQLNAHGGTNLTSDGWSQSGSLYWIQRYMGNNYYVATITTTTNGAIIDARGYISSPTLVSSSEGPVLATAGGLPSASTHVGPRCVCQRH